MDPFTQRMMDRARTRREKLDNEMAAVGHSEAKRRRTPLQENNPIIITSPSKNVEISKPTEEKPKPASPPPMQMQVEQEVGKENSSNEDKDEKSSSNLHTKLNRLGKLYAGSENLESMSSPVHQRTETMSRYKVESNLARPPANSSARTARLAELAKSIEEWEDDLTNLTPASNKFAPSISKSPIRPQAVTFKGQLGSSVTKKATVNSPAKIAPSSPSCSMMSSPSRPAVSSPSRALYSSPAKNNASSPVRTALQSASALGSPRGVQMGSRALQGSNSSSSVRVTSFVKKQTKTVMWDKAVIATLESQGFVPTESRSRLIYDYEKNSRSMQEEDEQQEAECKVDAQEIEEDEGETTLCSPATGIVSSPGWVYKAGSPIKRPENRGSPRMGLQSPVKKVMAGSQMREIASPIKTPTQSPVKLARSPSKQPNKNMSPGSVLHRAALFESAVANTNSPQKDPAELPLLQRMALFEKNKSQEPLLPKVAFSTPLPANLMSKKSETKEIEKPKPIKPIEEKSATKIVTQPKQTAVATKVLAQKAMFEKSMKQPVQATAVVAASQSERQQELEMLRNRWDKQKQLSQAPAPVKNTPHQERQDLDRLRNRWESEKRMEQENTPGTPPPPPPMPSVSSPTKQASKASPPKKTKVTSPTKHYSALEDVRKIRVSPPKQGRMYPCLSDIEVTESEMDADTSGSTDHSDEVDASISDDGNTSFGEEILQAAGVHKDKPTIKRAANEMTPSECAVLNDIDEFLDEALGSDSESVSVGPTPPKKSREVEADNFKFRTPAAREVQESKPSHVVEAGHQAPLMHTVSFYRKQQAQGSKLSTPVKQIVRAAESDDSADENSTPEMDQRMVQRKISKLSEEVSKQQTVISQASQALNLCRSTIEFSNSAEQVAAEKLLLVATQKRQAALHEIQRLKVEGTLHAHGDHTETGSLTISNLTLPLKKEYLAKARRADGGCSVSHKPRDALYLAKHPLSKSKRTLDDAEQYLVCLIRCQEHVLASSMLATSSVHPKQDTLCFPGSLTLEDLSTDFAVKVEVYTLQARRETISHEEKYHIKKESSKLRLTPKKQKHDSVLVMPVVQSPAGPSAVRSTSFVLAGYTVFSLREINRTHFTLNKVPYTSPLEGHIGMQLSCELHLDTEQRGFLTMFEDISGFGAWHRRWCVLDGARLAYWKYPDDERKKDPIGSIDLISCCTKQVGPVSRDECARPNTFLLETRRHPEPEDRESLVMILGSQYTTLRHLLSADTREERIHWSNELNRALSSMRAWRTSANSQACVATSL